jgi:general secretion pathway protein A
MPAVSIGPGAPAPSGYERFFGFNEPPFSLAVNTRFRFESASHREALSQVSYALERREPIVVVTGEIGTGKTMLCRTVVERLPRKTFLSIVNDPMLERDDLLKRILEDFGVISSAGGAAVVRTSRHDLVHALEKFLASLGQLEAHAVVILDEAQHIRADVLEEMRLLANMHDSRGTLLQIVLVGQPSLRALLDARELEQLRQRIARFVSLDSLSDDEVRRYIAHRLTVARETPTTSNAPGARDLAVAVAQWNEVSRPVTFTDEAVAAVARISRGVPRVVNLVCDRALETASAQQSRTVGVSHVSAAASLLQLPADEDPIAGAAPPGAGVLSAGGAAASDAASSARYRLVGAMAAVVIVAIVAIVAAAALIGGRAMKPSATAEPPAAAIASPPPAVTPPPAAAPPPSPSPPPEAHSSAAPPDTASPGGESYELVVASFRTEARATEVAKQIAAMGQKVRQRSLGGWQQVLAGPFASKAAADEAQQQLYRAGFGEAVIVRENR